MFGFHPPNARRCHLRLWAHRFTSIILITNASCWFGLDCAVGLEKTSDMNTRVVGSDAQRTGSGGIIGEPSEKSLRFGIR